MISLSDFPFLFFFFFFDWLIDFWVIATPTLATPRQPWRQWHKFLAADLKQIKTRTRVRASNQTPKTLQNVLETK